MVLTTKEIKKQDIIILLVNLIGKKGMDENAKEVTCVPQNVEKPEANKTVQVIFNCKLSGLNESEGYTSFRLNSSDNITGIPTDNEILLNPILTAEAIKNKEIKDYSKDSSIPPIFIFEGVDPANCTNDGKFILKGKLSPPKSISAEFTIPLTFPEGTSITCSSKGEDIECIADKELYFGIQIEQTSITEGIEELFILKNVTIDDLKCGNGLLKKAEEKRKVQISFRQVSQIQRLTNGFSFFFAAFVNNNLDALYSIKMNVIIITGEQIIEKEANCTLKKQIITSGEPTPGDFDCFVNVEDSDKIPLENVTISTNNDNIGGCSELTKEEAN